MRENERTILKDLARTAVPDFADVCTTHLLRGDGTLENVAAAGADSRVERLAPLANDAPLRAVLDRGAVEIHQSVEGIATSRADEDFLRAAGIRSAIVAPLVIDGAAAGAIRFMAGSDRRFGEDDRVIAEDVAHRAALAIDNARLRAEVAASGHSRDLFLAMLSHEMKTPLTSILGWTRMLRADGPGSELFAEALEAIEQSANVQQRLIDDLLDVSRIITGKLHLELSRVDIPALLAGAVETLEPRAKENRQHIRRAPAEPVAVYGDETRLRQVLWNLLTNAMKFTPGGGLIEVTTTVDADCVTIAVRDTGRGIRPEVLPHVFDRFHQATVADRAKHGGLGLGLAIVRNIVEMHGGQVEASSAGEGKGATFSVRLPLHYGFNENEGEKK